MRPLLDYRNWNLLSAEGLSFHWDHSYGPLRWKREGREMLRIRSARAQYWKLENLEDFDGERWAIPGDPRGMPGAAMLLHLVGAELERRVQRAHRAVDGVRHELWRIDDDDATDFGPRSHESAWPPKKM